MSAPPSPRAWTFDDVVAALLAFAPTVGFDRAVAIVPQLAAALGYDDRGRARAAGWLVDGGWTWGRPAAHPLIGELA
jgi:hypothetical protein